MSEHDIPRKTDVPQSAAVMIYVKKCENGVMSGEMRNQYIPAPIPFDGALELLLQLDALFNTLRAPVPERNLRCFSDEREEKIEKEFWNAKLAKRPRRSYMTEPAVSQESFLLDVYYRHHGSWQGKLTWLRRGKERNFLSALQFLHLLAEALQQDGMEVSTGIAREGFLDWSYFEDSRESKGGFNDEKVQKGIGC